MPWSAPLLFAEMMVCWEMRSYHIAERESGSMFFDRGVPDVLGYLRMLNLPAPDHMQRAAMPSAITAACLRATMARNFPAG